MKRTHHPNPVSQCPLTVLFSDFEITGNDSLSSNSSETYNDFGFQKCRLIAQIGKTSFSFCLLYTSNENVGKDFLPLKRRITALLAEEARLMEIVKLIGSDVLPDDQKLVIEIAKVIRVGFLQQNAFHADDTYVPMEKQREMMKVILYLYDKATELVSRNIPISNIISTGIFDKLTRIKYDIPNDKIEMFEEYYKDIDEKLAQSDR